MILKADWTQQIKESINLKTGNSIHLNWNTDGRKQRLKKSKQNLHDLWDSFRGWNISTIRVSEEELYNGAKHSLKEYLAKVFPYLTKVINPLIHEAQRINARKTTLKYIIVKFMKMLKEKLKVAEAGKQNLCYTEDSHDKNARRWILNCLTCLVADMLETKNKTQKSYELNPCHPVINKIPHGKKEVMHKHVKWFPVCQ